MRNSIEIRSFCAIINLIKRQFLTLFTCVFLGGVGVARDIFYGVATKSSQQLFLPF